MVCHSLWVPLRQLDKRGKIATHIGFLLRARPARDASLRGDRLVDSLVVFGEQELHGPARVCVASGDQPLHVFAQSLFNRATCDSSVVTAVGASQDVDRSTAQGPCPGSNVVRNGTTLWPISIASRPPRRRSRRTLESSFETPALRAPQDEGFARDRSPNPRPEERREASRLEGRLQQAPTQLYAGRVAGRELNPSGITFWIPWRTSSGVTPIAAQPLPP